MHGLGVRLRSHPRGVDNVARQRPSGKSKTPNCATAALWVGVVCLSYVYSPATLCAADEPAVAAAIAAAKSNVSAPAKSAPNAAAAAAAQMLASEKSKVGRRGRKSGAGEPAMTMESFLDRLMMAESGGRTFAKNPLSTAIGPFQFIASTWLQVARSTFADEIKDLKPHEILALRTEPGFARRAAHRYTMENAAYLVANGHKATFPNLRLAHLVGAGGAVRVLSAKPGAPVATLLGATVIGANPFMAAMTAEDLIARSARDIATDASLDTIINPDHDAVAAVKAVKVKAKPAIAVNCDLSLASCRRWFALAKRRALGRRAQR